MIRNVASLRFISRIAFVLCLLLPGGAVIGVIGGWLEIVPAGMIVGAGFGSYVVGIICESMADLAVDLNQIKRQLNPPQKSDQPKVRNLAPDSPAHHETLKPRRPKIHNDAVDQLADELYSRRWQGKAQRAVRKKAE